MLRRKHQWALVQIRGRDARKGLRGFSVAWTGEGNSAESGESMCKGPGVGQPSVAGAAVGWSRELCPPWRASPPPPFSSEAALAVAAAARLSAGNGHGCAFRQQVMIPRTHQFCSSLPIPCSGVTVVGAEGATLMGPTF